MGLNPNPNLNLQVNNQLCHKDLEKVHEKTPVLQENREPYGYFHELEVKTTEWAQVHRNNVELEVSYPTNLTLFCSFSVYGWLAYITLLC